MIDHHLLPSLLLFASRYRLFSGSTNVQIVFTSFSFIIIAFHDLPPLMVPIVKLVKRSYFACSKVLLDAALIDESESPVLVVCSAVNCVVVPYCTLVAIVR